MRPIKKEYQKWLHWIELIQKDIQRQKKQIEIYQTLTNEIIDTEIREWIDDCFFVKLAVAIRRQIGTQKDEISLLKLLYQIESGYQNLKTKPLEKIEIQTYINQLKKIETTTGLFIDRQIVHHDKRDLKITYKLKDLFSNFQTIEKISTAINNFLNS